MREENQTKSRVWEDSSLCPETSTKNADQEFYLWLTHLAANDLVISVEPDLLVLVQQGEVDHVELKGNCGREDAMKEI